MKIKIIFLSSLLLLIVSVLSLFLNTSKNFVAEEEAKTLPEITGWVYLGGESENNSQEKDKKMYDLSDFSYAVIGENGETHYIEEAESYLRIDSEQKLSGVDKLNCYVININKFNIYLGASFTFEMYTDDGWIDYFYIDDYPLSFTLTLLALQPEKTYNFNFYMNVYKLMSEGKYRIVKSISFDEGDTRNETIYAIEFNLKRTGEVNNID